MGKYVLFIAVVLVINLSNYGYCSDLFYTIKYNGWSQHKEPEGAVYSCSSCDNLVQVSIMRGGCLPNDVKYRDNISFIRSLENQNNQAEFANVVVNQSFPKNGLSTFKINRTGITNIGGIKAFQIALTVTTESISSGATFMMAIHKSKPVFISTTFRDGQLTKKDDGKIKMLFSSLKFL